MRMDTAYQVRAESEEAIEYIASLWEDSDDVEDCTFEGFCADVFGIMENVIKVTHKMEASQKKENFRVVGKCESDYDCVLISIEYLGSEPKIKAIQVAQEDDEEQYEDFVESEYDEIPDYLSEVEACTFEQAIEDELPLGGYLDIPYSEWRDSILSE